MAELSESLVFGDLVVTNDIIGENVKNLEGKEYCLKEEINSTVIEDLLNVIMFVSSQIETSIKLNNVFSEKIISTDSFTITNGILIPGKLAI